MTNGERQPMTPRDWAHITALSGVKAYHRTTREVYVADESTSAAVRALCPTCRIYVVAAGTPPAPDGESIALAARGMS